MPFGHVQKLRHLQKPSKTYLQVWEMVCMVACVFLTTPESWIHQKHHPSRKHLKQNRSRSQDDISQHCPRWAKNRFQRMWCPSRGPSLEQPKWRYNPWWFPIHGGTPSHHPFEIGIVPYKPTVLGYLHFRKPNHCSIFFGVAVIVSSKWLWIQVIQKHPPNLRGNVRKFKALDRIVSHSACKINKLMDFWSSELIIVSPKWWLLGD